ncbi:MAG: hypothetical protein HYR49_04350, partial [Gammaproteobacteria bacterium]|nr:hypothetical protein [Gammaproteobacteria bacterium]
MSRAVPHGPWGAVLATALVLFLLFAAFMEARLALRGYAPTLDDTAALWIDQRSRVNRFGPRALVLTGGSRMQLAADLDVLRRETGLEPVQLAIDGSSFVPVLEELASDQSVSGTVIVDVSDHLLAGGDAQDRAVEFVRAWRLQ